MTLWLRLVGWLVLLSGPMLLASELAPSLRSENLPPIVIFLVLISSFLPIGIAYRAASGTALQGAIVWTVLAITLAMISQVMALTEPVSTGRPITGQWAYLATLASFAAAISILNARRPGSGAWAILMGILVLVFLIPWLEGGGLARADRGWDRLRLSAPWTIFYGLLFIAGVTNFLPTRYCGATLIFGAGLAAMFVGLTRTDFSRGARGMIWEFVPWSLGASIWLGWLSGRRTHSNSSLERLWIWFRDHWGVVWGLRVMERFNRTAELTDWPIRLAWHGVTKADGMTPAMPSDIPESAVETLSALLRRFATVERLNDVAGGPCPDPASV